MTLVEEMTHRERVEHRREHDLREQHQLFVEGRHFKVVKPNARLEAILQFGPELISGWSRPLQVGEVLTCAGWRMGMDCGPGCVPQLEVNWHHRFLPPNAQWAQVWPMAGLFLPFPMPGFLEPVPEGVRYA